MTTVALRDTPAKLRERVNSKKKKKRGDDHHSVLPVHEHASLLSALVNKLNALLEVGA
jgi:hypothetical protein